MDTIFYVDDAVLIARSPEELQLMLNACQQKELQRLSVQTGVSAGQLRAAASATQVVASGALIQIPSPMTMSSEDEE